MSKKKLYKIIFMSHGQVYEIYARQVGHGEMFGFIEVEELVFGERTTVVVDPSDTTSDTLLAATWSCTY